MALSGEREGAVRPVLQIAMPRLPRIYSPRATIHVVARCKNREANFTARGGSLKSVEEPACRRQPRVLKTPSLIRQEKRNHPST
jgi:hypothetical protein